LSPGVNYNCRHELFLIVAGQLSATLQNITGSTNDYAAVNLGQLKAIVQPFYDVPLAGGFRGHPLENGQYPWVGGTANDYAMANIGQVKNLFSFDVTYDSSGLGVPDWWETCYFGSGTSGWLSGTTAAQGIPGLSLLQCYQQGLNPVDFYNGITATLTIVSGTNQTGTAGAFLSAPLVVQVTGTTGQPLANAPVTFTVTTGAGSLAPDTSGTWQASGLCLVRTGANGNAQIY